MILKLEQNCQKEKDRENVHCAILCELLVEGKYLCHFADALAFALAKEDMLARLDIFRMANETEQDRGTVIGAYFATAHDAFDDSRLTDAAYVNGGLEAFIDGGRMEQHRNLCLEKYLRIRLCCPPPPPSMEPTWKNRDPKGSSCLELLLGIVSGSKIIPDRNVGRSSFSAKAKEALCPALTTRHGALFR